MTPEEDAKHLSIKRLVCGCGEADCPRYAKVVDVIRVAVAEGRAAALEERDAEWKAALLECKHFGGLGDKMIALLNQGRDEGAPSPEITREGGAPRRSPTDTEPK